MPSSISSTTFPTLSTTDTDYYTFLRQNTYEIINDEYDVNLSTPYIFSSTRCNTDYYQREADIILFPLETKKINDVKIEPEAVTENNMKDDKQSFEISVQETSKKKKKQKKQLVALICNNR